ncbi:TetR/AcrR family transcriptional regulator [Kitasatospora sp. NPDC092286]|uniref:TetR/AcrR family transcriptional regulator n=1 Tax=Kitasatospora sp. NPDC092286 TaxID=3364087 RepID=UPI0038205DE9
MAARKEQIPSVWTRPQRARRRDQPALSREQIVAEAIAILDADGIEALSMRRLGTRLNAGATSMYTHVANKEELIELVVDEVLGELRLPDTTALRGSGSSGAAGSGSVGSGSADPDAWRAAITECADGVRATVLRHPWLVSVLGDVGLAYLGPNMMRFSEAMLTVLEEAGFELLEANDAMGVVMAFVVGMATSEASWLTTIARHGTDEQAWVEQLLPAAEEAARGHPRLHRLYLMQQSLDASATREKGFANGIRLVLDGIELAHRARTENR